MMLRPYVIPLSTPLAAAMLNFPSTTGQPARLCLLNKRDATAHMPYAAARFSSRETATNEAVLVAAKIPGVSPRLRDRTLHGLGKLVPDLMPPTPAAAGTRLVAPVLTAGRPQGARS
jgi:hypothetical protein